MYQTTTKCIRYTKWQSNIPSGHKMYHNFPLQGPPKFTPIRIFGSANIQSGNPEFILVLVKSEKWLSSKLKTMKMKKEKKEKNEHFLLFNERKKRFFLLLIFRDHKDRTFPLCQSFNLF
jgi:hypothetical protein